MRELKGLLRAEDPEASFAALASAGGASAGGTSTGDLVDSASGPDGGASGPDGGSSGGAGSEAIAEEGPKSLKDPKLGKKVRGHACRSALFGHCFYASLVSMLRCFTAFFCFMPWARTCASCVFGFRCSAARPRCGPTRRRAARRADCSSRAAWASASSSRTAPSTWYTVTVS